MRNSVKMKKRRNIYPSQTILLTVYRTRHIENPNARTNVKTILFSVFLLFFHLAGSISWSERRLITMQHIQSHFTIEQLRKQLIWTLKLANSIDIFVADVNNNNDSDARRTECEQGKNNIETDEWKRVRVHGWFNFILCSTYVILIQITNFFSRMYALIHTQTHEHKQN